MIKKIKAFLYGIFILHLVWFLASLWVNQPVLPNPFEVYGVMDKVFESGLWTNLSASLLRIFYGLILSLIIGVPMGLIIADFPLLNKWVSPLLYLSYPIPKLALLPVVFLLLGIGETSKVVMVILIIVFQVILSTRDAALRVSHEHYHILTSLGARRIQKLRWVTFPSILPDLLTAVRISIGTAISVLFFTETYGTSQGMGFYIVDAWMRIAYKEMYAGILILSFTGFILFFLMDVAEAVFCKWKAEEDN